MPRYDRLGASSRLRTFQFIPQLRAAGFDVDVFPLFDDDYVRGLYAGSIPRIDVLRSYLDRCRQLRLAAAYDIVWFEKEFLPWLPEFVEVGLLAGRPKLVMDCDDAVFHRYDAHASLAVRKWLGPKLARLVARADLVVAGNDYLARHARRHGAQAVEVIPTVVDLDRYPRHGGRAAAGNVVVGWIGSPSTAGYLRAVAPACSELQRNHAIEFVAVGANPDQVAGTPFTAVEWREESEAAQLAGIDIGIMPLPDAPWERGKCGYKLVQYMASGLPVIASPVGANLSLVRQGLNGYLANDVDEWTAHLGTLAGDPLLRARMGAAGRAMVEEHYCLQVQGPRLAGLMRRLLTEGTV